MLYIRKPLIKKVKFLKYKSSLSLQASAFNSDGKIYSKYPKINTLNFNVKFRRKKGINYYKNFL